MEIPTDQSMMLIHLTFTLAGDGTHTFTDLKKFTLANTYQIDVTFSLEPWHRWALIFACQSKNCLPEK